MRLLPTVLILVLLSVLLLQAGLPAQSQGLQWGFQHGDRYDFRFETWPSTINNETGHTQEQVYGIAPTPPAIPDPVGGEGGELPRVLFQLYFSNGTSIEYPSFGIDAVPIGNWTLLTDIAAASSLNASTNVALNGANLTFSISDTPVSWGLNQTLSYGDIATVARMYIWMSVYSKTDGVLLNGSFQSWESFYGDILISSSRLTRTGMTPAGQGGMITAAAAGVLVIALAAVVYVKKSTIRRSPSSSSVQGQSYQRQSCMGSGTWAPPSLEPFGWLQ